ncbi:hypothetical protein [Actinoplanes solisilvae]|uniref:hypothetical protein n=1 Tax=Actinoplanes solisilvae TaxID=2486853 RepID=UPI000FDCB302|nr:hypothetical protein [Actinoplanes solisilvae]
MIDETRQLRWYLGLGLAFLAAAPLFMMTLLAYDAEAPDGAKVPVFVAGPVNLVGFALVLRSMLASDREVSARFLKLGAVVVLAGDVLLYSVRALAV